MTDRRPADIYASARSIDMQPQPVATFTSSTTTMRTPRDVMRHREEKEARKRTEALKEIAQGQAATKEGSEPPVALKSNRTDRPLRRELIDRLPAPSSSSDMLAASQEVLSRTQSQSQRKSTTASGSLDQQEKDRKQATANPRTMAPSGAAAVAANPRTTRDAASSFPHAFERWENLSAHWEGLTSYWLHKLEDNKETLGSTPSGSAMSRQITDLSAAGANLFHAVVELQRLRASSERKFQRWFLELKQEQETIKESKSAVEKKLNAECTARAKEKALLSRTEIDRGLAEKRVSELTRELFINKEEARRAWEELGRREVEERDRTISLREGLPTVVGGVQVVPMHSAAVSYQGSGSRRPSTSDTRQVPVAQQTGHQGLESETSPTNTDPFTESDRHYELSRQQQSPVRPESPPTTVRDTKPAAATADTGGPASFYQHKAQSVEQLSPPTTGGTFGRYYGKSNFSAYVQDEDGYSQRHNGRAKSRGFPESSGAGNHGISEQRDSGHFVGEPNDDDDEYDDGDGWSDMVDDRHHHPTRLSDVIEEESDRPVSKHSAAR